MRLGAVFPQLEIGDDPTAIRDYAQAAEGVGYDHILIYDHVLGADARAHPGLTGPYRHDDEFHEPFVLYGYLAAVTERIELATGIIILPQRQTVLVAKQAAQVDLLSRGRLRLGIGIGWNPVEFEALGEDFSNRGLRSEEQVEVMRALWTNELVTFRGRWHAITDAGIRPLPVNRPIPVWFGGYHDRVLRRIGRMGDGWIIAGGGNAPTDETRSGIQRVKGYAEESGRDADKLGFEKVVNCWDVSPDEASAMLSAWADAGVTHVTLNTMGAGFNSPFEHINAISRFREAVG